MLTVMALDEVPFTKEIEGFEASRVEALKEP
jgi:hypothetical protein